MRLVAALVVSSGRPVRPVDGRHQPVHSDLVPRDSEEPLGACHCRTGWKQSGQEGGRGTNTAETHTVLEVHLLSNTWITT